MSSLAEILELPITHVKVPLLGLPAEQPASKQLTSQVDRLLRDTAEMLREMLLAVLQARTRAEFTEALTQNFAAYAALVRAFSEVVSFRMPAQAIERLSMDSLLEFEADLRANGEANFGAAMTERALFTVWTLRRITGLLSAIINSGCKIDDCDIDKDKDFYRNFLLHALVSRFCVDCLVLAMHNRQAIYPEALAEIDDRLRSAVDAYAWIRQAADLRLKKVAPQIGSAVPLDTEEQQLLNESMFDLTHDDM